MEEAIIKKLNAVGIKKHVSGYSYWVTAIKYALKHRNKNITMFGHVYVECAKRHKKTTTSIERALRYALSASGLEKIKEYFSVDYDISNHAFLSLITEEIYVDLNK